MNERESDRIRRMADEGTITRAEADRLLAVLDEIDGVEDELDAVDDETRAAAPPPPEAPRPPTPPSVEERVADVAERAVAAASRAASAARAAAARAGSAAESRSARALEPRPGVERWLRLRMLAGEVEVRTRPDLEEIEIERGGESVAVERDGSDWIVRQFRRDGELIDRIVGGLKSAELTLAVPPGTGVDLDMKAGEVRIDEVPFVYGDVLAGEVVIAAAHGVDLRMRAGELRADLLLTEGEHHLSMTAGEASVRLIEGSSVAIDASVSLGELNIGRALGGGGGEGFSARWQGTVGDGSARLVLRQSTGELSLDADVASAGSAAPGETSDG